MRGDVFFPTTFSPTPPLPIIKSEHDSPPSSPSSTPPSTPPYSSSPSSTTSAFSSPVSAFSTPAPQYLSSSAPSHPSPFLSHSPPSSPCPTPPTTTVTAATLFFPPRSSTPYRRSHSLHRRDRVDQDEEEDGDVEDEDQDSEMASPRRRVVHNLHHRSLYRRHHRHRSVTRRSSSSEESSDKPSAPKSRVRDNPVHVDDHRRIGHVVVDDDVEVEVEADDDAEIIDIELDEDEDDDDDVEDDAVEVVNDNDVVESSHHHHRMHDDADGVSGVAAIGAAAVGFEVATFLRRVTLKPRRTLSLSPTPARPGDMSMGRNLRAACCLDFTNKDDDDGLCRPADSDPENAKRKPQNDENGNLPDCPDKSVLADACNVSNNNNNRVGDPDHHTTNVTAAEGVGDDGRGSGNVRFARRGAVPLGASSSLPALSTLKRSSVKRPLEVTLPCQEIQYLDISYQKVGTNMVQFSPIPRKKIAYHPVLHHTIHYCEVSYCGNTNNNNNNSFFNFNAERPVKRKPLVRSHSFAV